MTNPPLAWLSPLVSALHALVLVAESVVNSHYLSLLGKVDAVPQSEVSKVALVVHIPAILNIKINETQLMVYHPFS